MVDAINSVSNVNVSNVNNQAEIKKLIKYVNNEPLKEVPDTFTSCASGAATSAALFEGIPLLNLARRNKKLCKVYNQHSVDEKIKALADANSKALENLKHGKDKLTKRIVDFAKSAQEGKNEYFSIKSAASKELKNAKSASKLSQTAEKTVLQTVEKTAETAAETTAKKGILSKFGNFVKSSKLGQCAKNSKVLKFMKSSGAGVLLAFSGIYEGTTEVIPTFKELGKEKGFKQLGKSAVKVAGDTFGYIGGEAIGTTVGTALGSALLSTKVGAAIGSVVPGLGTAIGAAVGLVGGLLGSFLMGKVTKAITGKSEREKAKEKDEQNLSKQIEKDDEVLEELKNAAKLKIQDEYNTYGTLSEDSQIALETLEKFEGTNPFAA